MKISIPLQGAALESGLEAESLWAEPLGGDRYLIWNVPVFAYNIEMRAVVVCEQDPDGGPPIVKSVVTQGDCRGIRVYLERAASDEEIGTVLDLFSSRRAVTEKYSREVWAFGMRTLEDNAWVGPALAPFAERGVLWFESNIHETQPTYDPAALA